MTRSQAYHEVQRDDAQLRVTLWRLAPGTETGWHIHGLPYLIVPVAGGELTVEDVNGSRTYPMEAGKSYSRGSGVEHNVANDSGAEIAFVEVELKSAR
jgi:beta-alanine degradation protein BauB